MHLPEGRSGRRGPERLGRASHGGIPLRTDRIQAFLRRCGDFRPGRLRSPESNGGAGAYSMASCTVSA